MIVKAANLIAIQHDRIHDKLSSTDICTMFNQFLVEFERMEKGDNATTKLFLDAVEDIVDAVLSILPYKLLDPKVLNHPLMHFIQQLFMTILDNWCVSHLRINIQETDILLKIVLIFVHIAEQAFIPNINENEKTKNELLATKQLLFKVREQVDSIILNKENSDDDPNIWAVGLLTIKLLQGSPFYYTLGRNHRLINDLIMNSLDSYDYRQIMLQLQHGQPFNDIDSYLFATCWQYLSSTSLTKQNSSAQPNPIDLIHYLSDELLIRLEHAIDELLSIAPPSLAYVFERCHQLLNIHNLQSFDKHAQYMIDRLINILQEQLSTNPQDQELINVTLEAFHNLSKNTDIRTIMKNRQLTSIFYNYISTENAEQQKLGLSILAEIMDEKEINEKPNEITSVFIDHLKQLNLNEYDPNMDSTLASLKVLMQHEQIKNRFVQQNGLNILVSFIRDGDSSKQSDKQQEKALKILWLNTFNNLHVINMLQQDLKLMTRVNDIYHHATEYGNMTLEKAAEGLIWKVEEEEKFKKQQDAEAERKREEKRQKAKESGAEEEEEEEAQYDLMISYSWADMDLAHRIFHHLTDKLGYSIWLGQEQTHGSTIQAMANAVDNAQFILMCMSDTYKRSANCQSEAEYAHNRKKHIVPCKMKKDYNPDGWLGFILGTRMYIDFGSFEFEKAIELLDNEVQLQKKKRKEAREMARLEKKLEVEIDNTKEDDIKENDIKEDDIKEDDATTENDVKEESQSDDNKSEETIDMDNVSSWSESVVRRFLKEKDLTDFLPLCDGINGQELIELYVMCKMNSVSMYRCLKSELLKIHDKVLLISTFLHFIERLRAVCDRGLPLDACICNNNLEECLEDAD
ncbi:unnamed protein product [Adineta steineri]|uniref:TIR domain-containing protein n=1 Tax=Adineta steineri TaxID=433720 RepID=A0A815F3C5_9BILA|nr:unnamed protein product [Adineta steineri]